MATQLAAKAVPAEAAVFRTRNAPRPRRVLSIRAQSQRDAAQTAGFALAGAAAAALLSVSPVQAAQLPAVVYQAQEVAQIAATDATNVSPELGTPGSETRYKKDQPLPGDEEKIREARRTLLEEEKNDIASKEGAESTKTNTFLDPYGRKESAKPDKAGPLF